MPTKSRSWLLGARRRPTSPARALGTPCDSRRGAIKKKQKQNPHEKTNPGKNRPTDFPFPFFFFFFFF
jgi:hypothetical protein